LSTLSMLVSTAAESTLLSVICQRSPPQVRGLWVFSSRVALIRQVESVFEGHSLAQLSSLITNQVCMFFTAHD
jgi:hypothetical protein